MKNRKPTKQHRLLNEVKVLKEFREADKIISYLENPDSKTELTKKLQKQLDLYRVIYSQKASYKTNLQIVGYLKDMYPDMNDRKARYAIVETEYIYGKVLKVNHVYEIAYLLEASRKNMQLAMATKDVNKITKAILAHKEILGEEIDESKLPDFSKWEANQYNFVLPPELTKLLQGMLLTGAIDLSEVIPSKMIERAMDDIEDAQEVNDEE